MYYNELEAKKAAIQEHEEQTGNALLWHTDCALNTYKQEFNSDYRRALQEYLDEGGTLPCWVVPQEGGCEFEFYANEEDAINAAYEMI